MALLMGLTGSLHCAGMCGPIMMFLPFQHFRGLKRAAAIALYHFGRISVYALMTLVVYSFRSSFNPRWQQYVSVSLGAILLLAGLLSFLPLTARLQVRMPWSDFVKRQLGRFMGAPGLPAMLVSGMLNGMLPCGLIYMVLSATTALHSVTEAVLFTYFFGLGTMPMLVSIILFRSHIMLAKGVSYKKFTPVFVFVFGCIFLLRGMNLGIPYLSPKVQVTNGQIHSSCCHKN